MKPTRVTQRFGQALLLTLLATYATSSLAADAPAAPASATADGIIVKYRNEERGQSLDARVFGAANVAKRRGIALRYGRSGALGIHVLKMDRVRSVAEAQELAREIRNSDPNVEYAEPDRIMYPAFVPNDSSYSSQWHYFESTGGIDLPYAWDLSTGAGIVVAVIDTGYRAHTDLAANLLSGYDFISNSTTAGDGNGRDSDAQDVGNYCSSPSSNSVWHGTHVAGTIAAVTNNSTGVAGVAFGAKVVPVRVLGRCGGNESDIADAIIWASGGTVSGVYANPNPARVLNLSLGGSGSCGSTYQNAINSARSRGSVVVVAAGNNNADASNYAPGNCTGVITVAATGRYGSKASYSNYGSVVEIAAPGGDGSDSVLSTYNTGTTSPGSDSYGYLQGTSMATPHVAGVAALLLSRNYTLTPDDVLAYLQYTARAFPGTCSQCGSGIVDAYAAVGAVSANPTVVDNMAFVGGDTGWESWTLFGYGSGAGSLTPHVTSNGMTINNYSSVYEYAQDMWGNWYQSNQYTQLVVTGFTVYPGKEWLVSIAGPGGVTLTGASATLSCYMPNSTCTWTWPQAYDMEVTTTLTITHK